MSSFKKKNDSRASFSKSEIGFYKGMGVFALCCVFILLVMKMQDTGLERISSGKNLTNNFYEFCHTPLFIVIAGLALVCSAAWFIYCRVKKRDESGRIFTSTNCFAIVLYLMFFSACFGLRPASNLHGFFIVVTIGAAALYFAPKFYKADFIVYSVITAVMAMSIYLWGMLFEPYIVVTKLVVIALCTLLFIYFKKKLSKLKVSKQTKSSFLVYPCIISLVMGAVLLFWAYFQNMEFLYGIQSMIFLNRSMMLLGMSAQYIVFAIVYTVRRIRD